LPEAWAEAGAAPWNNISGVDPGLRDPAQGDFRADGATGYGCRVFAEPVMPAKLTPVATPPATIARGRLDVGGIIASDTVWDAAEVRVIDDVEVVDGARLTVAAGARVVFPGYHGLTILDGSLQAVGTPDAPIVFTSERADEWTPDYEYRAAWRGLSFLNVPAVRDSSRLRWCVLECAKAIPDRVHRVPRGVGGAQTPGTGGALSVVGTSNLLVDRCIFRRNLAERGGAVAVHYGAAPLLVGNLFHDNHALLRRAGLYAAYSYPLLIHNTFTANSTAAPSSFTRTGCIDHYHSRPLHVGQIVWDNPNNYHEGLQIREVRAFYTLYCAIEGFAGGEGCLDTDPRLDPHSEPPFALAPDSPAVDAGMAAAAATWLPDRDLTGGARVVGADVDMGAQEFHDPTTVLPVVAPVAMSLAGAPNPFNPRTTLSWDQPIAGQVRLTIHDLAGRRVRVLADTWRAQGVHRLVWNGRDDVGRVVPAGSYITRITGVAGAAYVKIMFLP